MEIIHLVLGKANPERMNGVNKVAHNLATYQANLGYNVTVWGITNTFKDSFSGVRNYNIQFFKVNSNKFTIDYGLIERIGELDHNVVIHIHGGFIPEFYQIGKLLYKKGIPYIFTSHGSYNAAALKKSYVLKKIYFQLFEKYLLKRASAIHCIGVSEVESVKNLLSHYQQVILIPNGQQVENYENRQLNKSANKLIFSFCGRLKMKVKGLDILLKGFSKFIKENDVNTELWMIGEGESENELRELCRTYQITKYVKFWGSLFGSEKNECLLQSDVFVHTSRYEGLPTAVLEASSLGLPSLISQETNMGTYITEHDAGITLLSNTPENVAEAMVNFYILKNDNKLMEKGENAKKMVTTRFSWENISEQLISAYKSAA